MKCISEHAIKRFKERYNCEMPDVDYLIQNGIKQQSINRKGHIVDNKGKGIYRTIYQNQIIEYVLSKHRNGDYVICTFNTPPKNINDICFSYIESED